MTVYAKLSEIQKALKAPKGQFNKFGNYAYRSCEDILTAVKPLLDDHALTINDEVKQVGDRYYIVATATLVAPDGQTASVSAAAREQAERKGMDSSQITGATSSYARKYALNGLFAIDDTKDADTAAPSASSSDIQQKKVSKLVKEKGRDLSKMLAYYSVSDLKELTADQANDAIKMMEG